jgi:hypothetical protein
MKLEQLLLLHLMAGAGVAVCVYLSVATRSAVERWFQVVSAVVFWPLYLPLLLSRPVGAERTTPGTPQTDAPDALNSAIAQVNTELEEALHNLDGWAEDIPTREQDRLQELRSAWSVQANRIREMDQLLSRPEYVGVKGELPTVWADAPEQVRSSQEMIRQNIERLRQVRQRTEAGLLGSLARVRELISMIHLTRFTDAPVHRTGELVAQIAAEVHGLSATNWSDVECGSDQGRPVTSILRPQRENGTL